MTQAASAPLNGANRYAHIDAMRAFAVLLVVLAHAGLGRIVPGGSGVTIFFSISGFIITYLLLREHDKDGTFSARGFYFRRAAKIVPPFALIVVIPSLCLLTLGKVDFFTLASQILFVFNWAYISGPTQFLAGSDVVWSLAIEEQFYILFALIWFLLVRTSRWRMALTVVASSAVLYATVTRVVMASSAGMTDRIYYGSDTRMDGIAWGVLAAIWFHWLQRREFAGSKIARFLAHDFAIAAAVGIYTLSLIYRDATFRDTLRYTLQSLAACTVILYGLLPGQGPLRKAFFRISQSRVLSLIGLASYSIYLIHLVLMNTFRSVLDVPVPIAVPVYSAVGVAGGILVYKFVELPVHKWSRNWYQKNQLVTQ